MGTHSPEDALDEKDGATIVEWNVSPNSPTTEVPSGYNEWRGCWEARVVEPARDGRANQELLNALEDLFDAEARIVSGEASRRKSVVVRKNREEVLGILKRETGDLP